MSTWNNIQHKIKKVAIKAVSKTGDLTDTASLHVKLARKEANLGNLYEQFGRVAYQMPKRKGFTGSNQNTVHFWRTNTQICGFVFLKFGLCVAKSSSNKRIVFINNNWQKFFLFDLCKFDTNKQILNSPRKTAFNG